MEDEIWENQRWSAMAVRGSQVYRGWSEVALLPGERGGFSDRLGTMRWEDLAAVPIPAGWRLTKEWTLDLQWGKCNSEGWTYAQTFASLDANLASGRTNSSASARWLVRRRRWFRIREYACQSEVEGTEGSPLGNVHHHHHRLASAPGENLLHLGWLGMRGITTGRWSNCFTFIPKIRPKENLGFALCYYKKSAKVFNEDMTFRYEFDYHRSKHVRVKFLDNLCVVSDSLATREHPGLFSLHLCGEAEPRVFNAHSAEARVQWIAALNSAIKDSPGPCYEAIANRRSMRKGAAWELLRASDAVKGLVGGSVRGVKNGLLTIKHRSNHSGIGQDLHRAESDPDMAQIESLREEFRRNDAIWTSVPRKHSTDSIGSLEIPTTTISSKKNFGSTPERMPSKLSETTPVDVDENSQTGAGLSDVEEERPSSTKKRLAMITRKLSSLKPIKREVSSSSDAQPPPQPLRISIKSATSVDSGGEQSPLSSTLAPPYPAVGGEMLPPLQQAVEPGVTLSVTFDVPPPYDNIVFDGYFDMTVDDFDTLFFREEEFTRDILTAERMTEIELEPWTNGISVGSEHRRKYRMPRAGVVPPGVSLHLLTRTQSCPGKGYVVDQVCSTPEMPFGQHFSTDFRNVLVADSATRCRVIISQRVTLFKPLMAQGFIRSGTKREITAYYKNFWTGFTRKWVAEKRGHLLNCSNPTSSTTCGPQTDVGTTETCAVREEQHTTDISVQTGSRSGAEMSLSAKLFMFISILVIVCLIAYAYTLSIRLSRLETLLEDMNAKLASKDW